MRLKVGIWAETLLKKEMPRSAPHIHKKAHTFYILREEQEAVP